MLRTVAIAAAIGSAAAFSPVALGAGSRSAPKKVSLAKKPAAKKVAAKPVARKPVARKPVAKKPAAKKVAPKKAPVRSKNMDKEFCYGLPGALAPAGNFDPANLLEGRSKEEVYRFREAELTHGRVGMLAALGFLVQENFHPLFTGAGGPAIQQIPELPPWIWFIMTLGVGIAESARIQLGWANPYEKMENVQALKPEYYPGDLNFDPLGLKPEDPEELRLMQTRELQHGRLGMLAAAGFLAQEAVTGTTWGATDAASENLILGGWFAREAADLATLQ